MTVIDDRQVMPCRPMRREAGRELVREVVSAPGRVRPRPARVAHRPGPARPAVDPLRYRSPREAPLPASARAAFNEHMATWLEDLSQPDSGQPAPSEARAALATP